MRRILLLVGALVFTLSGFSQSDFSISFKTGYDQNINHLTDIKKLNTNQIPDFSAGVDLAFYFGKKFRLRGEVGYSNVSFLRDYQTDASVGSNISYTKMAMNRLDFNPNLDYRLFSISKLDVYASAGLLLEFNMGDWQRTYNHDGDKLDGSYFNDAQTSTMFGASGSLIMKYNINDYFGITVAPEYNYFFAPLFTASDYNLQRMGLNVGVEWKF